MTQTAQLKLIKKVHGENAITAILYAAASKFKEIITREIHFFPILFNKGTFASGKTEISETMQSLTSSTMQSFDFSDFLSKKNPKVLKLQLNSPITVFEDYAQIDDKHDFFLKSVWDRVGYQRDTKSGSKEIEEIKINSALVLNSNQKPESIIVSRFVWNEFSKNNYTKEEIKNFEDLQYLKKQLLLKPFHFNSSQKKLFKQCFSNEYIISRHYLHENLPRTYQRILDNYLVLIVTYDILKNYVDFPFKEKEMYAHFCSSIRIQNNFL
jgi:hypothetical protein